MCKNNNGASNKLAPKQQENMMSKIKIYPKYCDGCNKGIMEGYTGNDETVKMCQSCFNKDKDWQTDFKNEWDKFEKNNNYEPTTYWTNWTDFEWCEVFLTNGDILDLSEVFGDDFTDKQVEEKFQVMYGE